MQAKFVEVVDKHKNTNEKKLRAFASTLANRALRGQVLPWLTTEQGLLGYVLSHGGTLEGRQSMARAATRWAISCLTEPEHGGSGAAAAAQSSLVGLAEPHRAGTEYVLDQSPHPPRPVSLRRRRPEFLGARIIYRRRRESRPDPACNGTPPNDPPTASPAAAPNSEQLPRHRGLSGTPSQTPLQQRQRTAPQTTSPAQSRSGLDFLRRTKSEAAGLSEPQVEADLNAEPQEIEEEWSDVVYLGGGGEAEARAFAEELRARGELGAGAASPQRADSDPPPEPEPEPEPEPGYDDGDDGLAGSSVDTGRGQVTVRPWHCNAATFTVPAETEFAVEVWLRPNALADPENAESTDTDGLLEKVEMHWSLLSAQYDAELEDLVEGTFDLSVLSRPAPTDWSDTAVQMAAACLNLDPNGADWMGDDDGRGDHRLEPTAIEARSPRLHNAPAPKAGVKDASWEALSPQERRAARRLGWRKQAKDGSWVEGEERLVGGGSALSSRLCFSERRPRNSPDRPALLAAGAAGTCVKLRLDVEEEGAHEANWLLLQIDVDDDKPSAEGGDAGTSEAPSVALTTPSRTTLSDAAGGEEGPPPLSDLLAVLPAAAPAHLERVTRQKLVESYRALAVSSAESRQRRWGRPDPEREAAEAAAAAADEAEQRRVATLLECGATAEELRGVGLGALARAGAGQLARSESEAAMRWAKRCAMGGMSSLWRSRMEPQPAPTAEEQQREAARTAEESERVGELLLDAPGGLSEELLMQREVGAVASIVLQGLVAKELAPYLTTAKRAAAVVGMLALLIPMLFGCLVALGTNELVKHTLLEMRELD